MYFLSLKAKRVVFGCGTEFLLIFNKKFKKTLQEKRYNLNNHNLFLHQYENIQKINQIQP